jgi:hypothetical protein
MMISVASGRKQRLEGGRFEAECELGTGRIGGRRIGARANARSQVSPISCDRSLFVDSFMRVAPFKWRQSTYPHDSSANFLTD